MKGEATEKYLSTGEFARICGVEKHVLFHYEEIGLFQPVLVLENGYRYYSYHQYDTFVVIRLLRSLGMSLRDIGVYLDQRTPERVSRLAARKGSGACPGNPAAGGHPPDAGQDIRHGIRGDRRRKGRPSRTAARRRLLLSEDLEDSTDRSFASYMQQYIAFSKEMHPSMQEFVGSMLTVGNIRREEYWNYSYLYMFTDRKKRPARICARKGSISAPAIRERMRDFPTLTGLCSALRMNKRYRLGNMPMRNTWWRTLLKRTAAVISPAFFSKRRCNALLFPLLSHFFLQKEDSRHPPFFDTLAQKGPAQTYAWGPLCFVILPLSSIRPCRSFSSCVHDQIDEQREEEG